MPRQQRVTRGKGLCTGKKAASLKQETGVGEWLAFAAFMSCSIRSPSELTKERRRRGRGRRRNRVCLAAKNHFRVHWPEMARAEERSDGLFLNPNPLASPSDILRRGRRCCNLNALERLVKTYEVSLSISGGGGLVARARRVARVNRARFASSDRYPSHKVEEEGAELGLRRRHYPPFSNITSWRHENKRHKGGRGTE